MCVCAQIIGTFSAVPGSDSVSAAVLVFGSTECLCAGFCLCSVSGAHRVLWRSSQLRLKKRGALSLCLRRQITVTSSHTWVEAAHPQDGGSGHPKGQCWWLKSTWSYKRAYYDSVGSLLWFLYTGFLLNNARLIQVLCLVILSQVSELLLQTVCFVSL